MNHAAILAIAIMLIGAGCDDSAKKGQSGRVSQSLNGDAPKVAATTQHLPEYSISSKDRSDLIARAKSLTAGMGRGDAIQAMGTPSRTKYIQKKTASVPSFIILEYDLVKYENGFSNTIRDEYISLVFDPSMRLLDVNLEPKGSSLLRGTGTQPSGSNRE